LLLRGYNNIGQRGIDEFEVGFTPDGDGSLFQAPSFNPHTQTLMAPTILERDTAGRTVRRVTAVKAVWSEPDKAWLLIDGKAIRPGPDVALDGEPWRNESLPSNVLASENLASYHTDLTPHVLLVRRYNQFAAMLSLGQINQMLGTPQLAQRDAARRDTLLRYAYSRLSSVLVNLLVLGLTLPCFLLREPANLLRQSVLCAGLAIPAMIGSAIGMMVQLPGIPPAVGVFVPVIVLAFMSLFPWTFFKT
jgi:lipopolysaccharide export LptBFGC system permease protein LptF